MFVWAALPILAALVGIARYNATKSHQPLQPHHPLLDATGVVQAEGSGHLLEAELEQAAAANVYDSAVARSLPVPYVVSLAAALLRTLAVVGGVRVVLTSLTPRYVFAPNRADVIIESGNGNGNSKGDNNSNNANAADADANDKPRSVEPLPFAFIATRLSQAFRPPSKKGKAVLVTLAGILPEASAEGAASESGPRTL